MTDVLDAARRLETACQDFRQRHTFGTPERYPGSEVSVRILDLETLLRAWSQVIYPGCEPSAEMLELAELREVARLFNEHMAKEHGVQAV